MKLLLLGTAREKSSRMANKMLRPFAGSSLYEIYLRKFEKINSMEHPFDNIGMAINKNDKTLWAISENSKVPTIERSDESVTGLRKRSEELHFLKDVEEDHIMWVNGCLPFLKPETIIKAATFFKSAKGDIKSLTSVRYRYNWFWDPATKEAINNKDPKCASTQGSPPLLETTHAFHIFNRQNMLENDSYWNLKENDPYLYVVEDDIEFMDIDSELDFRVCEILWPGIRTQ
jgi:CMP-N-acetylneuraminic acid synthetase